MKKLKVAIGLSGGVDSAISAYLLKKHGFDVSGVYLHCFDEDAPGCRGRQDRQDAIKVALHLKIPFQVLDFIRQYKAAVINYFKKEYLAGRTPNPDVVCNRDIKFGLFLDWAIKKEFDAIATGHYAKLIRKTRNTRKTRDSENTRPALRHSDGLTFRPSEFSEFSEIYLVQPKDLHKDQTYFLWQVPKHRFSRVLFPLSNFCKSEVRSLAKLAKIPVAAKPDSTGICFVGEVKVENFLKSLGVEEKAGNVIVKICDSENSENSENQNTGLSVNQKSRSDSLKLRSSGDIRPSEYSEFSGHIHADSCYRIIGTHRGVAFYTIGQRHGFSTDLGPWSLALGPNFDPPPFYVIAKDVKTNRLIVGFGSECYRNSFEVSDCNWFLRPSSFVLRPLLVRLRHLGSLIPCRLELITNELMNVFLSIPQRGIAPGQSAVFYSKEGIVLGGGVIQ